jgi:hypothetical protein
MGMPGVASEIGDRGQLARFHVFGLEGLDGAGLTEISVRERPDWAEAEHAIWVEAAALDAGDDSALAAFHEEGVSVLQSGDRERRVMATARRRSDG